MAYNIADFVEHAVDLMPERIALADDGREISYSQLEDHANRLANYLLERGVKVGDKVGIYSRNTPEAVIAMIAIFKARAVMVNVNYRYVENELRYLVDNSDMVALIHEHRYSDKVAVVQADSPLLRTTIAVADGTEGTRPETDYQSVLSQSSPARDFGQRSPDDHYMIYTGGTTGMPKGVLWRQEDVWRVLGGGTDFVTGETITDEWSAARSGADSAITTSYPVPPLIHGGSQWATLLSLFRGGKTIMMPQFDGHTVWRTVERHHVNLIFITGDAMARPMLDALAQGDPETGRPYDVSSLGLVASTAALFSPSIKDALCDKLPHCALTDSIGSSETGFTGMASVTKGGSQDGGPRVRINASTLVLDEAGDRVEPGSDVIGVLAKKGHLPLGYYKDAAKTEATFKVIKGVRYAIPGDFARVESDGTVTMLGRGASSINSGGEKIFPEEVEGALKAHPEILDALVVGIPDERFGHRVAAVVQSRGSKRPTLAELRSVLIKHIAPYKVPRSIWFVDEIKRSPAGKPDYRWAMAQTASREADETGVIAQS